MKNDKSTEKCEDTEMLRNALVKPRLTRERNSFKDNPFVPLGCFGTIATLACGLWAFRRGRANLSQRMMKLRIIAQGFTITAIIAGFLTATDKSLK